MEGKKVLKDKELETVVGGVREVGEDENKNNGKSALPDERARKFIRYYRNAKAYKEYW